MKDKMYHIRRPFSYPKKWIKVTVRGGHQRIPVRKVADISTRTISDPIGRKENDILRWKEYKTLSIEKWKVMLLTTPWVQVISGFYVFAEKIVGSKSLRPPLLGEVSMQGRIALERHLENRRLMLLQTGKALIQRWGKSYANPTSSILVQTYFHNPASHPGLQSKQASMQWTLLKKTPVSELLFLEPLLLSLFAPSSFLANFCFIP